MKTQLQKASKTKQSISSLADHFREPNTCATGVSRKKKQRKNRKKYLKKYRLKNLKSHVKLQTPLSKKVKEAQGQTCWK